MNSRYYLLAQTSDDLLVIGMKGQKKCVRRTAAEILAEPKLLEGLSAPDRAVIEAIASMSSSNPKRRRPLRRKSKDCI